VRIDKEFFHINLNIEDVSKQVDDAIVGAELTALEQTVADAKELSPKVTGHNAESIQKRLRRVQGGTKGTVFTESGYGGYIEAGTRLMQPHPYIYPAAQKNLPLIPEIARAKIADIK
jgi:HK97 gp10 family phage protein